METMFKEGQGGSRKGGGGPPQLQKKEIEIVAFLFHADPWLSQGAW